MARDIWDAQEWNVPDWRTPGQYDQYNEMSAEKTQWEFLRRHPRLRHSWLASEKDSIMRVATDWETDFGILGPYSPRNECPPKFPPREAVPPYSPSLDGNIDPVTIGFVQRARDKGHFLASWDPKLSTERNITAILAGILEWESEFEIKTSRQRQRRIEYPKYLRALDAYYSGEEYKVIADALVFEGRFIEDLDIDDLSKLFSRAEDTMIKITGVQI